DGEYQQQGRDGVEDVNEPHHEVIHPPSEIAGQGAEYNADSERQQYGDHTYSQGNARTHQQPGKYIAAIAVGAKIKGAVNEVVLPYVFLLADSVCSCIISRQKRRKAISDSIFKPIIDIVTND